MRRREADRFEEALQVEAQGGAVDERLAPLVAVARKATVLAGPPPPPPYGLSPGRQRFLAEAARIANPSTNPRKVRVRMATIPVTVLTALMLVFGLFLGAGQVAADSLPGDPLYGIKLMAEEVRMVSVAAPASKAELTRARAVERLDEVALLLESGEAVNEATALRAQEQLRTALQTAARLHGEQATRALQRLEQGIQQRQRKMESLAGGEPDTPLQRLLRETERVRLHACDGQENLDRLRLRLRDGSPPPEDDGESGAIQAPEESGADTPPDPDPSPDPGGNGNADPNPEPAPDPGGNGNPDPNPEPAPDPGGNGSPDPNPDPAPDPGGNGNPDPNPEPAPDPGGNGSPDPNPEPAPDPGGNSSPDPEPDPAPEPGGNGNPDPEPDPSPDPGGSGDPDPDPDPQPDPGDNGSGGGGKP